MAPTAVFMPGESHGQRSLAGYSPWSCKELDMTETTQHTCTHRFKSAVFVTLREKKIPPCLSLLTCKLEIIILSLHVLQSCDEDLIRNIYVQVF